MENTTNSKKEPLKIYTKYLELIYYTQNIVKKYPKCENFALVKEIKQTTYAGLRNILYGVKVYSAKEKLKHLSELDINLDLLKVFVRISYNEKYISLKNYEAWSELIANICNMLGGWIKTCQGK